MANNSLHYCGDACPPNSEVDSFKHNVDEHTCVTDCIAGEEKDNPSMCVPVNCDYNYLVEQLVDGEIKWVCSASCGTTFVQHIMD